MNKVAPILMIILIGCGGSLSDDQRKRIKEDMQQHQIVKVTDAEITEAAFAKGRQIMKGLNTKGDNAKMMDSLSKINHATIKFLVPGAANALEIENQLIEAYLASDVNGGMESNVQRLGADSLLYTQPLTEKMKDGAETVKGIWSIRLSKKDLILGMRK
jgi:hypothetical protein